MSLDETSPLTFFTGNTMKHRSVIVSSIIIFRTPVQPSMHLELPSLFLEPSCTTGGKYVAETEIDALLIHPSDMLKVLPGAQVPADGVVTWGSSYVNESMVTGESVLVFKEKGIPVIGGTVNLHGILHSRSCRFFVFS